MGQLRGQQMNAGSGPYLRGLCLLEETHFPTCHAPIPRAPGPFVGSDTGRAAHGHPQHPELMPGVSDLGIAFLELANADEPFLGL